jgi:transposase-like protein
MPKKSILSFEKKLEIVTACLAGETTPRRIAAGYDIGARTVRDWINIYKTEGSAGLEPRNSNRKYPDTVKESAAKEYLEGSLGQDSICEKYGIHSRNQLRDWIKVYNSGGNFNRKMSGGSRMKQGRETTQEERVTIAKECLENGSNYGEIAIKYNVSYQQAYNWVKRFSELGEVGLEDRRGKRTAAQKPRSDLEEMKIKMAQLEHELYMTKMERDLLKKVDELERRDVFHK